MNSPSISVGAVILGAGRSSRMGQPKLMLPWGETSVIGHLLWQWEGLGAKEVVIVCAVGDDAISSELDRLKFPVAQRISNPAPERGMFSSIRCAAAWGGWLPQLTHFAVVLGDQPHLRLETLENILVFSAANPKKVCQPRKEDHRYHPVVLPRNVFESLSRTSATNLKEFLQSCESVYCEMNDPGLELDIDRPEDYQKALKLGKT